MKKYTIAQQKKAIRTAMWLLVAVTCMVLALFLTGCVNVTDANGNSVHVAKNSVGMLEGTVDTPTLQALLKGSIYETGEKVSLYGACLDMNGDGMPGSYALLQSWYPNGTQQLSNVSMAEIQTGYFLYTAPMSAVSGTYLTQVDCYVNGTTLHAKAFGEWQNPLWVSQINQTNAVGNTIPGILASMNDTLVNTHDILVAINGSLVNLSFGDADQMNVSQILNIVQAQLVCGGAATVSIMFNYTNFTIPCNESLGARLIGLNDSMTVQFAFIDGQLLNITQLLQNISFNGSFSGNITLNLTNEFNITWTMIQQVNASLTQQIQYTASVANSSVDRNDSYLALLLQNISSHFGIPITKSLTLAENAADPVYFETWTDAVTVYNEFNQTVDDTTVECFINTTNSPPTVNGQMQYVDVQKQFVWSEQVLTSGDFSWAVACNYK